MKNIHRTIVFLTIAIFTTLNHPLAAEYEDNGLSPQQIEDAYHFVVRYYNPSLSQYESLTIAQSILSYSGMFDVDPRLVVAVIVVESRFRPYALSRKGAMGLGQLMPGTARGMGIDNPFDIQQNIYGTVRYLREQMNRWGYSDRWLDLALAAYNAGPEAVERYRGIPPYSETINYVRKVKRLFQYFKYGS